MICPICYNDIPADVLASHLRHAHALSLWRVLEILREMAEALGREVEAG